MLTAIIFNIAFPLSSGWLVLHGVFGIDKWVCILSLTTLTAIYTILGGLSAVVMTETIQASDPALRLDHHHRPGLRQSRRLAWHDRLNCTPAARS